METNIKVAGTTFHPIPKDIGLMVWGETTENGHPVAYADAVLMPEPTNVYDPEAVAVYTKLRNDAAHHLGYLPKADPMKQQIKTPTLAVIKITDYGYQSMTPINASFVIIQIGGDKT